MDEKFFTVAEVAERYSVAPVTVYGWIREGLLQAVKIGRRCVRITRESLEAFENARVF